MQFAPEGGKSICYEQFFLTDRKFEAGRTLLVAAPDHRHRPVRRGHSDIRLPHPELSGHVARLRLADALFGHSRSRAFVGQQTLHHGPRLDAGRGHHRNHPRHHPDLQRRAFGRHAADFPRFLAHAARIQRHRSGRRHERHGDSRIGLDRLQRHPAGALLVVDSVPAAGIRHHGRRDLGRHFAALRRHRRLFAFDPVRRQVCLTVQAPRTEGLFLFSAAAPGTLPSPNSDCHTKKSSHGKPLLRGASPFPHHGTPTPPGGETDATGNGTSHRNTRPNGGSEPRITPVRRARSPSRRVREIPAGQAHDSQPHFSMRTAA